MPTARIAALVLLAASCQNQSKVLVPRSPAARAPEIQTPAPTFSPASASPALPASSATPAGASPAEGVLRHGSASFRLFGAVAASATIGGLAPSSSYSPPPPGDVNLTWTAASGGPPLLAISGPVSIGTQSTSAELHLSVTAATSSGSVTAVTSAGECSIAVSVESAIAFVGTFTCAGLPIGGGTAIVNASGVFSATA